MNRYFGNFPLYTRNHRPLNWIQLREMYTIVEKRITPSSTVISDSTRLPKKYYQPWLPREGKQISQWAEVNAQRSGKIKAASKINLRKISNVRVYGQVCVTCIRSVCFVRWCVHLMEWETSLCAKRWPLSPKCERVGGKYDIENSPSLPLNWASGKVEGRIDGKTKNYVFLG